MATNFSPCKGSYVLNQFPSNVMFGMNGFHVSTSGAIQGHHGPLVFGFPHVSFHFFENNVPHLSNIPGRNGNKSIITVCQFIKF